MFKLCRIALFIVLLITTTVSFAQSYYHRPAAPSSAGYSGTGANIDVRYHKLSWRINPDSSVKYIKGFVQTNFITNTNTSAISFDLNSVLVVDSVKFRNAKLPAGNITRAGNILNISLGTTLASGTLDSVWVYYQGTPPGVSGAAQGYQKLTSSTAGNHIQSLSESYEDRDWWPCKADMQDKIDSIDILVNVPWGTPTAADTFWVATNGKLIDSTITGTSRTFHYRSGYPIASYLVCVAVAKFNRYYSGPVNINGTLVPSVYYLLRGKPSYTSILTAMDKMNGVLSAFSNKFGDYPFKKDKHGYYDGLSGAAGMEHQTFSAIAPGALTSIATLIHELMHQWFGDNVTFSTWNDLWLAEGFARYAESLAGELVPSLGVNAFNVRKSIKTSALALSANSAWIPNGNIANSNLIWNSNYGSTVYERGAMIVSMLRTLSGDAKFYQATTNYQTNLAGKSATADSLKNYFNAALGVDLTPFFDDYAGGSGGAATAKGGIGNPDYVVNWSNPQGNQFAISVASQLPSTGSNVTYFNGPVVLHVTGSTAQQDTTIVFFDWGNGNLSTAGNGVGPQIPGNLLTYQLSFSPLAVAVDDSARTLVTGTANKISVIPVKVNRFSVKAARTGNVCSLLLESTSPVNRVELLRSRDGIHYSFAGYMTSENVSALQPLYSFSDDQPYATTYYKAKVYYMGTETYSTVVRIKRPGKPLKISPNPARSSVLVKFDNPTGLDCTVRILAQSGEIVRKAIVNESTIRFDISTLPSGVYPVQIEQAGELLQTGSLVIR